MLTEPEGSTPDPASPQPTRILDEDDESFIRFMDCFLRGASLQDIYSDSDHGYATRRRAEAVDPEIRRRQIESGRKEFLRIYQHLQNIVNPLEYHIELAEKRVLDFGCGTGALSVALALRGARVVAVDPAAVSLEACRWRARYFSLEDRVDTRLVPASPGLPLEDGAFDLVISNSVMEFIPRGREDYIVDLLRLVRQRGYLVISTENGLYPLDYYTRQVLPMLRRRRMIARNLPYGVTYFELRSWIRRSPRRTEDLSVANWSNSADKVASRQREAGRRVLAASLDRLNTILKGSCRLVGIPSDILFPYCTFVFRVVG